MTALLAKYFNSEVHILGLLTSSSKEIRFKVKKFVVQAEDYFTENGIKFKTNLVEADNITEETLKYAKEIKESEYSKKDIITKSGISTSYLTELTKGVKLAN